MSAGAERPTLDALMDGYAVLGVEYAATPPEIRQAFKRLVRQHHPDRFPPGTSEQQQATQRMAALNTAYRLVRDIALSRGIGVALSAAGIVLYLLVFSLPSGWMLGGPFVGVLLVWAAYFLAVQTTAGLYLWRMMDLVRLTTSVVRELNRYR